MLGLSYHELYQTDKAVAAFQTALLLAETNHAKRKNADCLFFLRKAAELRPDDAETHRRLANVYALLGQLERAQQEKDLADRLTEDRH